LKGDAGEWNEVDFDAAVALLEDAIVLTPSEKVDIRFKFAPDQSNGLPDKTALTGAKTAIENAIKTMSGAASCQCRDATESGTKLQMICRVSASNNAAATTVATAARSDLSFATAVQSAVATSRRALRSLTVSSTTDSSVVQSSSAVPKPSVPTAAPTHTPTQASGDGFIGGSGAGDIAGNFGTAMHPSLFSWALAILICILFSQ
jgi:hypothetical protein